MLFDQGYEMEVAENVTTPTRKAVLLQKGNLDFNSDQSENEALTKAKLLATEASLSAWLKQERSKHNEYLRLIAQNALRGGVSPREQPDLKADLQWLRTQKKAEVNE